jgi:hypothetical protein
MESANKIFVMTLLICLCTTTSLFSDERRTGSLHMPEMLRTGGTVLYDFRVNTADKAFPPNECGPRRGPPPTPIQSIIGTVRSMWNLAQDNYYRLSYDNGDRNNPLGFYIVSAVNGCGEGLAADCLIVIDKRDYKIEPAGDLERIENIAGTWEENNCNNVRIEEISESRFFGYVHDDDGDIIYSLDIVATPSSLYDEGRFFIHLVFRQCWWKLSGRIS